MTTDVGRLMYNTAIALALIFNHRSCGRVSLAKQHGEPLLKHAVARLV